MRNINELIGIIRAVDFDGIIVEREIDCLREWVESNRNLVYNDHQLALIKLVENVIEDNIITQDEREQLYYACAAYQNEHLNFNDKIYELHGVITGIISDGIINEPEVRNLKLWLEDNISYLKNIPEVEFLNKTVDRILEDNIVTEEEQEELLKLLQSTIEERRLKAKIDFLRYKVTNIENIGVDLIDLLNNEDDVNNIHYSAERELDFLLEEETTHKENYREKDMPIIFISLVLIAMMYYDGNFYDNVAKVYVKVYKKYNVQKVNAMLRKIIAKYKDDSIDQNKNARVFVGTVLSNAIVPNNYLESFFEFIHDIYKVNMKSSLSNDLYEDFYFTYEGLRNKLMEKNDDLLNVTNKTYKLIKSTKDLILDNEKVDAVIKLSIMIVRLVDKYVWNEEYKIVNPYLKHGFTNWIKKAQKGIGNRSSNVARRNSGIPHFHLKDEKVFLVPNVTKISGSTNYKKLMIEVYNGDELIYTKENPAIEEIIGGYEVKSEEIELVKPLGKIRYFIKGDGIVLNRDNDKLFRDYIVFDKNGFEIKNNTDYTGVVAICHNDTQLKEYAYYRGKEYSITEKIVRCGDSLIIDNTSYNFTSLIKPGVAGNTSDGYYLTDMQGKVMLPVYSSINYLAFESDVNNKDYCIIINAKEHRLDEFNYNVFDRGGVFKYTVNLDLTEPGIYSIAVVNILSRKVVLKKNEFVLDPNLDVNVAKRDDENYLVTVESNFLKNTYSSEVNVHELKGDCLKITCDNVDYIYQLPLNLPFYRLNGKEWRTCSQALWMDDLNDETTLEFLMGGVDSYSILYKGIKIASYSVNQSGSILTKISIDKISNCSHDFSYVAIQLYKNNEPLCKLYCNFKCNLNLKATEFDYQANEDALIITPYYYGKGYVRCCVTDTKQNILYNEEVNTGVPFKVNNFLASQKYKIAFYEINLASGNERLMHDFVREYYSIEKLAGKVCKINAMYFSDFDIDGLKIVSNNKINNIFVVLDRKTNDECYKGRLFDDSTFYREWFFNQKSVDIEFLDTVNDGEFDVGININGYPLVLDEAEGTISKSINNKGKHKVSVLNISVLPDNKKNKYY